MAWDPTKPANNSALVSAEIRANWDALNSVLMASVAAVPAGTVLYVTAGRVMIAAPGAAEGFVLTHVGGVPTWQAAASGPTLGPHVVGLPLESARFPDGTAGNLFPQPVERVSTGTPVAGVPKLVGLVYAFDATAAEWLIFKGTAPPSYAGGAVVLVVKYTMASAIAGTIRVSAAIGATIDGSGDVRAVITGALTTSPDITVPGTLGVQAEARVTLTDIGGLNGGRKFLMPISLGAGAVSSAAGDRVLEAAWLELAR